MNEATSWILGKTSLIKRFSSHSLVLNMATMQAIISLS